MFATDPVVYTKLFLGFELSDFSVLMFAHKEIFPFTTNTLEESSPVFAADGGSHLFFHQVFFVPIYYVIILIHDIYLNEYHYYEYYDDCVSFVVNIPKNNMIICSNWTLLYLILIRVIGFVIRMEQPSSLKQVRGE